MDTTLSLDEVKAVLCDEAACLVAARPEAYGYVNRAPHEAVAIVVDVLADKPELAEQLAAAVTEHQAQVAEQKAAAEKAAADEDGNQPAPKRRGRGSAAAG